MKADLGNDLIHADASTVFEDGDFCIIRRCDIDAPILDLKNRQRQDPNHPSLIRGHSITGMDHMMWRCLVASGGAPEELARLVGLANRDEPGRDSFLDSLPLGGPGYLVNSTRTKWEGCRLTRSRIPLASHPVTGSSMIFDDCSLQSLVIEGASGSLAAVDELKVSSCWISDVSFQRLNVKAGLQHISARPVEHAIHFSLCTIRRFQMMDAELGSCAFTDCHIENADFSGSWMLNASFRDSVIQHCVFTRSKLSRASFEAVAGHGLHYDEADLSEINGYKARLHRSSFVKADLSGARLQDADLSGSNMSSANLRGAKLQGAKLRGVDFTGADLTGADLTGAILDKARLTNAIADGAIFDQARAADARFDDANLLNTRWHFAEIEQADFTRARIGQAGLARPELDPTYGARFRGCIYSGVDLSDTSCQAIDTDRRIKAAGSVSASVVAAGAIGAGVYAADGDFALAKALQAQYSAIFDSKTKAVLGAGIAVFSAKYLLKGLLTVYEDTYKNTMKGIIGKGTSYLGAKTAAFVEACRDLENRMDVLALVATSRTARDAMQHALQVARDGHTRDGLTSVLIEAAMAEEGVILCRTGEYETAMAEIIARLARAELDQDRRRREDEARATLMNLPRVAGNPGVDLSKPMTVGSLSRRILNDLTGHANHAREQRPGAALEPLTLVSLPAMEQIPVRGQNSALTPLDIPKGHPTMLKINQDGTVDAYWLERNGKNAPASIGRHKRLDPNRDSTDMAVVVGFAQTLRTPSPGDMGLAWARSEQLAAYDWDDDPEP